MSAVQHMVCPCCAQMHGREHVPVCPMVYEGEGAGAYEVGWCESRSYHNKVLHEIVEHERAKREEAEALVAVFVALEWIRAREKAAA